MRAVLFCRPLHLAIIHEQTAVIKQLIEVVVSIPSQQIINITNNLQQVCVPGQHCHIVTEKGWGGREPCSCAQTWGCSCPIPMPCMRSQGCAGTGLLL